MQNAHDASRPTSPPITAASAPALPAAPRHLDARQLRLVLAVAREANVTRAAGQLHLSQSAVSHQLLDLERALATRLFDRVGKRMVVTPAGARVVAAAERLLPELTALEDQLEALRGQARTPLRITASCFTQYNWLPAALAHFSAKPTRAGKSAGVELELVIEATRRAVAALAADEVDLAIVTDPPRDPMWSCVEVCRGELVALVAPDHPVAARARRGQLRWGALHDAELLLYDISDEDLLRLQRGVQASWRAASGAAPPRPLTVRKIPLSDALIELARAGHGVGIVDHWTVLPRVGRDLLALHMRPREPRTFYAVWRRSNPRALPMQQLVALIRKAGGIASI